MLKRKLSPLVSKVWENPFTQFTAPEAMTRLLGHGFPVSTVVDIGASDGRWSRKTMAYFPRQNFWRLNLWRSAPPRCNAPQG